MIATRCMMQAVYFASGTIEEPLFRSLFFISFFFTVLFLPFFIINFAYFHLMIMAIYEF